MSKYQDRLNEFAEKILAIAEKNDAPWQKPWEAGKLAQFPHNSKSGREYSGINLINLACSGYNDPRWMTFNQAVEKGGKVRKGEKSTPIFFYTPASSEIEKDENNKPVLDSDGKEKKVYKAPIFKVFSGFNATQIEGIEQYQHPEPTWKPKEKAEEIIKNMGLPVVESQLDRAFYSPDRHAVEIPPLSQFKSESAYYSTIFHELAHSTQHESSMGRETGVYAGQGRAREELIAEVSAWLTCTQIGIGYEPKDENNNQRYLQSWLQSFPADQRAKEFGLAVKESEKVAEYMISKAPSLKAELESFKNALVEKHEKENAEQADKTYINVPFDEKNEAKELGAKWDKGQASWYIPNGVDPKPFEKWLTPKEEKKSVESSTILEQKENKEKGEKTYINVPFNEKNEAKELGAKWDKGQASWFIPEGVDPKPFEKWTSPIEKKSKIEFSMSELENQIKLAGEKIGLIIDQPVIDDAKVQRCAVEGDKKGQMSGAYKIFADGRPAGFLQNHKTGEKVNFKYEGELTNITFKKQEREKQQDQDYEQSAKKAFGIYINAEETNKHSYLKDKNIENEKDFYKIDKDNRLIIPVQNLQTKKIESLQFIAEDGTKTLLTGGKKAGNGHILGDLEDGKTILLTEGFATGKTVHDVSNMPAIICFDANNLENVAKQVRELYPTADLYICADNDHAKKNNVGVEKAQQAAKAVGAKVIIPKFTEPAKRMGYTDFNDLLKCKMGKSRIEDQLKDAIPSLNKEKEKGQDLGLEL